MWLVICFIILQGEQSRNQGLNGKGAGAQKGLMELAVA
jgi:hypothetical protein